MITGVTLCLTLKIRVFFDILGHEVEVVNHSLFWFSSALIKFMCKFFDDSVTVSSVSNEVLVSESPSGKDGLRTNH